MRSMKVEDVEVGSRQTEIRDVTLADGTKIRKQMPDFKDKDTSQQEAKQKALYLKHQNDEKMSEE